jgi:hypothetical protein
LVRTYGGALGRYGSRSFPPCQDVESPSSIQPMQANFTKFTIAGKYVYLNLRFGAP